MNRCTSVSFSPFVVAVTSFPASQVRRMAISPFSLMSNDLPLNSAAFPSSLGLASSPLTPHTTTSANTAVSALNHKFFWTISISLSLFLRQQVPEDSCPLKMVGTRTRQIVQRTGSATPEIHLHLECLLLFDARHDAQQSRLRTRGP